MSIALGSGSGLGGPRFGRRGRCACAASPGAAAPAPCSSSSVGRNSGSSASAAAATVKRQWDGEEAEDGDGEVQSSYKGPFDTMDALQDALPLRRPVVANFYRDKAQYNLAQPKSLPVPRKRKGLLTFSFKGDKRQQHREMSLGGGVSGSPMSCRGRTLSPAAASSSGSNSSSDITDMVHKSSPNLPPRHPHRKPNAAAVFASPPAPSCPQLFAVHMRPLSMVDLQDVIESTALVSPREKRRKNSKPEH